MPISCAAAILGLSACSEISSWISEQRKQNEEEIARLEKKPVHPVGVTYDITGTDGTRKQVSMFFNGDGLARILDRENNWDNKTILDYKKQEITRKDYKPEFQETKTINPYEYPAVLNADGALKQKAMDLGSGFSHGYPYHRWSRREKGSEWEVWTDDNDNFPIYYRSIKNGEVTTWTILSSWIDGSTYNKPTFFTLEPDPPPPEPEKKAESRDEEAQEKTRHNHKHHAAHKHSSKKSES